MFSLVGLRFRGARHAPLGHDALVWSSRCLRFLDDVCNYQGCIRMSYLRFKDGVSFNTSGPLRLTYKRDGLYVVGNGMMIPVRDANEGQEIIRSLVKNNKRE